MTEEELEALCADRWSTEIWGECISSDDIKRLLAEKRELQARCESYATYILELRRKFGELP
jgi:hypothetical protein